MPKVSCRWRRVASMRWRATERPSPCSRPPRPVPQRIWQSWAASMRLLDRVGMASHCDKYPGQLSGGHQQRVAIGRALAMDPLAMLFDEPTSALDPEMVREVLDVMVDLAQQGMTMLCVTHEMGFAKRVAHRVVFMDAGRVVADAETGQFFGNPQNERARQFLSNILSH
ncbi:MAG: amino acid ABC transporter ATP-binding protein [Rhizobiales bacterium]|nr:amino acid ABC transporter ATP-binding protein [Rhizobacter sp.]